MVILNIFSFQKNDLDLFGSLIYEYDHVVGQEVYYFDFEPILKDVIAWHFLIDDIPEALKHARRAVHGVIDLQLCYP
jgi:hypothetical protein